jgi:hypothetical protein
MMNFKGFIHSLIGAKQVSSRTSVHECFDQFQTISLFFFVILRHGFSIKLNRIENIRILSFELELGHHVLLKTTGMQRKIPSSSFGQYSVAKNVYKNGTIRIGWAFYARG